MLRLTAIALAAALIMAACGDDDNGGGDPRPTPPDAATGTPTQDAEPTELPIDTSIREVDLASTEPVQTLAEETGGALAQTDVLYADLTEDNVEEAVAPLATGGSGGNVAVTVLTPEGEGGVDELFQHRAELGGGLVANVVDGRLVVTEPAPGPDDPECCPSQLRTIIYRWDGSDFVVETETVGPNPQGGSKTPVSP